MLPTPVKPGDRYRRIVEWSDEDGCFVGTCPDLFIGGVHGPDEAKVREELDEVVDECIRILEEDGDPLPNLAAEPS